MKWLAVASLLALVSAEVVRIGIQRSPQPSPDQWRKIRGTNKAQGLYNEMSVYFGNFTIGTPPQQFVLALNTYRTGTWVYDSTRRKSGFNSSLSKTYVKDGRAYNDEGFLGNDTITFGGVGEVQLTLEKGIFAQLDQPGTSYPDYVNGEFGIGFRPLDGLPSPIVSAFDRGLLDEPIFSLWLEQSERMTGARGQLTYGGMDTEHCGDVIAYEPTLPVTSKWDMDWRFSVTSVGVGDYMSNLELQAEVSTFRYIAGPTKIIDELANTLGLKRNESLYNLYIVDCHAELPPISMTIGGIAYEIESRNYIVPSDWFDEGSNVCQFGFDVNWDPQTWTLGLPFMRQFCTVYDFKEEKIGFAPQKK